MCLWVRPVGGYVIYLEFTVCWRKGRLDWREVDTDDVCTGMLWGCISWQRLLKSGWVTYHQPYPCTRYLSHTRGQVSALGWEWERGGACYQVASETCGGQCQAGHSGSPRGRAQSQWLLSMGVQCVIHR
jgi:hypothetical protein